MSHSDGANTYYLGSGGAGCDVEVTDRRGSCMWMCRAEIDGMWLRTYRKSSERGARRDQCVNGAAFLLRICKPGVLLTAY